MTKKQYTKILSIAGSDSGGGAGIQADIKTIASLGAYATTAITALTAQNTQGVQEIYAIKPSCVAQQIESVLSDIGADAVKIGMLHSPSLIETVKESLRPYSHIPIILDPVMVAQSGDVLLAHDAVDSLTQLIPMAEILTPNIQEAEILLEKTWDPDTDLCAWGRALTQLGAKAVLLKGGHTPHKTTCNDILYYKKSEYILEGDFVHTNNNHGTGCTLSSALATYRAQGKSIYDACVLAKKYISSALASGATYRVGKGHGPVHHGFNIHTKDKM